MTDQPTAVPGALTQLLQAQLRWQLLMWRMPLTMWSGWQTTTRDRQAVPNRDVHAQLTVPETNPDKALFA